MSGAKRPPNGTPSHALLVNLTRRAAARGELDSTGTALSDPDTRAAFLRLARELGVEGLALTTLKASRLAGSLPPNVAHELDTRLEQLRRHALLWELERDRVLHVLGRQGITPLLLKGSALRERVYDDPTERSMGDLDLLVATEELASSVSALRQAGYTSESEELMDAYRRHHFHYLMRHPRGFIVELHWGLTGPASSVPLNDKQFVARASTSMRGNNLAVRVPSPEDLLLHTVSQNEDDAFGLLRRIVDIDRIVARSTQLDWQYVERTARESGLDLVLAVSLRLAEVLLRTDVPSHLSRGAGLPVLSRLHLAMLNPAAWVVSLPSERQDSANHAFRMWCARTWSARAQRAAETLRGAQSVAMLADDGEPRPPRGWRAAGSGAVRATKLALYHLLLYGRSSLALASAAGRRQLRFWS
jgi:hypothetical protein